MPQTIVDSIALYRLPHQNTAHVINGVCSQHLQPIDAYFGDATFVISPFNGSNQTFAIKAQTHKPFDSIDIKDFPFHFSDQAYTNLSQQHYTLMVGNAIQQMEVQLHFNKVVLSRTKSIPLISFDPIIFFEKLTMQFPAAFVYLVSSPVTGTWIGATPELLLGSEKNLIQTAAIAGTLPTQPQFVWGQKEKEEQKLVEQYIEVILNKHGLIYNKKGPHDLISGSLRHLYTKYNVHTHPARLETTVSNLIASLNPTSAVCGMDLQSALNFIASNEGYNRNFYSGFVGIIEPNQQQFFVNLRCMEWQKNVATLFAGAGITQHSNPQSEYLETEKKMQALQQFLNK